jgi:hypothetical protein
MRLRPGSVFGLLIRKKRREVLAEYQLLELEIEAQTYRDSVVDSPTLTPGAQVSASSDNGEEITIRAAL